MSQCEPSHKRARGAEPPTESASTVMHPRNIALFGYYNTYQDGGTIRVRKDPDAPSMLQSTQFVCVPVELLTPEEVVDMILCNRHPKWVIPLDTEQYPHFERTLDLFRAIEARKAPRFHEHAHTLRIADFSRYTIKVSVGLLDGYGQPYC